MSRYEHNQPSDPDESYEEQMARTVEAIQSGAFRDDISCEEARHEWFVMARTMYVDRTAGPRLPIDLEVGIHTAGCQIDECRLLAGAYYKYLKFTQPGASELLSDVIDQLEEAVMPKQQP